MPDIKRLIKKILCPIQCFRFHIKDRSGQLYIGKSCKIVNGQNMSFGEDVSIMPYNMLVCHENGRICFEDGVEIGMYSRVAAQAEVHIGRNVFTGPHVFIADYNHEYRDTTKPIKHQGKLIKTTSDFVRGGVSIGDDTWIGTNVVIAGTIKIGRHCVIGANSVVTKDVPDYCVAAGIPCKVVRQYSDKDQIWERTNF